MANAFPDGYKCMLDVQRPDPHHQAAYSHGGTQQTIYAMLYTFYENINDYRMAALEHQKVSAEREFYAT